jgi:hypothetical protein
MLTCAGRKEISPEKRYTTRAPNVFENIYNVQYTDIDDYRRGGIAQPLEVKWT